MKIKLRIPLLSTLVLSLLSCVIIAGCDIFEESGEPKITLSKPAVYRIGSIFTWDAVEKANKYIVSFGGGETEINETSCRIKDIEKGGNFTVKAVNKTADGKIKEQSETVEVIINEISETSTKYKRYELSDADIIIPEQVEKAVIVGDGETYGADILIDTRSTPLIVELYDVHCYYFGLKNYDTARADECVIVRSLGQDGSSFKGVSGSMGETGATGGGLLGAGGKGGNGANGGIAGNFNYVIFEGDKPLTFRGGRGGEGGTGGVANGWNSSGGNGGNGGTGGTGLSATNAYVALEGAELSCAGGSGGSGGEGGYGKFAGLDSGDKGSNGSKGADFLGNKTEANTYPVIEKSEPADDNKGNNNEENGENVNAPSGSIIGTYKFYSAEQDGKTYYAGDEVDGNVIRRDFATFIINGDGTCNVEFTLPDGEKKSAVLTWEKYDNTVFFTDENENITKSTISGDTLSYTLNGLTITLKRG